ncbi:MAG: glycosyltransferase [Proteobacteria bacterium]|nr:glycosyltransferase [Pseudomonadota bacterium]
MNDNKIAFITWVKDEQVYQACLKHLDELRVPEGLEIERIVLQNVSNLAASYNLAVKTTEAKYKVYLHQETMIIHKNFLLDLIKLFKDQPCLGMIGVLGSKTIPTNGVWWDSNYKCGKVYENQKDPHELKIFAKITGEYEKVRALDGMLLATQRDVPWREDLFDSQLYAELAQVLEMERAGYTVAVPQLAEPWCCYNEKLFVLKSEDEAGRNQFLDEYSKDLFPLVSILIPTHNRPHYLELALNTALKQTYRNTEIIVSDNGDDEASRQMIEPYLEKHSKIKYYRKKGMSVGENWEKCLELETGEYRSYLLDDDLFHPDKTVKMMHYFLEYENIGLVTSCRQLINETGAYLAPIAATQKLFEQDTILNGNDLGNFVLKNQLNFIGEPTTVLFKVEDMSPGLGYYLGRVYTHIADVASWLRIIANRRCVYISETLSFFRLHQGQEQQRIQTQIDGTTQWWHITKDSYDNGLFLTNRTEYMEAVSRWTNWAVVLLTARNHLIRSQELDADEFCQRMEEARKELPRNELPSVSIITVTCNSAKTLKAYLNSIFACTRQPFEVIVVDNASIDNTRAILAGYGNRITTILNNNNLGYSAACNQGVRATQSDYVVLLNPDSFVTPDWLNKLLPHFTPAIGAVGPTFDYVDGLQKFQPYLPKDSPKEFDLATLLTLLDCNRGQSVETRLLMGFCMVLSRQALNEVGLLDEDLLPGNDNLDISWRLRRFGYRLLVATDTFIYHEGQVSFKTEEFAKTNDLVQESTDRLYAKLVAHYGPGNVPPPEELWGITWFSPTHASFRSQTDNNFIGEKTMLLGHNTDPDNPLQPMLHCQQEAIGGMTSIIILTFNKLEFTKKCVKSLQMHTPEPHEIIFVDNGSTDNTVPWLKGLVEENKNYKLLENKQNFGFAKACNQGADAAQGTYLLFLNNDTEVRKGWLEPLLHVAEKDASVAAVGSKLLYSRGTIQHGGVIIVDDRKNKDPLQARNNHVNKPAEAPEANKTTQYQALTAACVLINKADFKKIGGFDEKYWNGYEDIDLCFKLGEQGKKLVYQPASVVIHYESQSGPERFIKARDNIARLHKKWLGKIKPDIVLNENGSMVMTESGKIRPYSAPLLRENLLMPTTPYIQPHLVSIIILTLNQLEHTKHCLHSIEQYTPETHELILVDNGSTDGTPDYLRKYAYDHNNVRVIANKENLGFAAGNNQGLAVAKGGYLLLLNNDTVVTRGWLARMLSVFERYPKVGIVGPVSNYVSGPQQVKEASYRSLEKMHHFAKKWSAAHKGQTMEFYRVVGFCLLAKREVIDRIGGLDEQFGSGNFEDDDFCFRAAATGYKARIALDAFVHHTGSQTFKGAGIDYRQSLERNWVIFKRKWKLPQSLPYGATYNVNISTSDLSQYYIPLASVGIIEKMIQSEQTTGNGLKQPIAGLVSIILCTSTDLEPAKKCLQNIKEYTPEPHEIILITHGSSPKVLKWAKKLVHEGKIAKYVENPTDLGFAKENNQGIKAAKGEYILLLSDNVVVTADWLAGLLDCLKSAPDAGIVGPMTNRIGGLQEVISSYSLSVDHINEYAKKLREGYRNQRIPIRQIPGMCMLFKGALIERIGLFDESFGAAGLECDDFCLRAALEGHKNYIVGDVFVYHTGKGSLAGSEPGCNTTWAENMTKIENKWHLDAQSVLWKKLSAFKATEAAVQFYHDGLIDKAAEALIEYIKIVPDEKELYYELARMFIESKRFSDAFRVIESMPEPMKNELKSIEYTGYIKEGLGLDSEADIYVNRLLSIAPDYVSAINLNGLLVYKSGDVNVAEQLFKEAIRLDPGYGEPYKNLGLIKWKEGRSEEALQLLERSFILSPAVNEILIAFHSVASSLKAFERAEYALRNARQLFPHNKKIALFLIDVLMQQSKHKESLEEIKTVMKIFGLDHDLISAMLPLRKEPDLLEILEKFERESSVNTQKACLPMDELIERGNFQDAKKICLHDLEVNPSSVQPLYKLAIIAVKESQITQAIAYLKRIFEIDKDFAPTYALLTKICISMGALEEARNCVLSTRPEQPKNHKILNMLDNLQERKDKSEDSSEDIFERKINEKNDVSEATCNEKEIIENLYKQAVLLQEKGKTDLAIRQFEIILEIDKDNPEVHNDIGVLYFQQENIEKAIYHLQQAVKLDPENIDYKKNIADVYLQMGKIEEAVEYYRNILERYPDDVEVLLVMARLCSQAGLEKDAHLYLNKVLEIEPDNEYAKQNIL